MPTNQSQILFLLFAFAGGVLLGAIVMWLFAGREKETPPHPELDKLLKLREQYQERVGLWIERTTGKFIVRMDDQMASSPQQLSDGQRKQLQTLMREWLTWMGFPGSAPAQPQPAPAPVAVPATAPTRQAVLVTPVPASAAIPSGPAADAAPVVKKSIVEQINDILQEKLASSPVSHKAVRIVEDARQGVVVWVGLDRYNGVDAVTDPEVKAVLKSAVAEWERRAGRA